VLFEQEQIENHQTLILPHEQEHNKAAYFTAKRMLDLAFAITLVVLLSPVMALIAILIKLDSPGPALFKQERVGAQRRMNDGVVTWRVRNFVMYKFRTMVQNADPSLHQQHVQAFVQGRTNGADNSRAKFKLNNDPRVTRVGRFLRKTSLDELPQLFNVIKGQVSLVGPRPVPTYEVAHYEPWHRERLAAWPGITGLWQINGRCALSFDEMIKLDIDYIHRQSFWLDLKIMALTIPAVLSGRGAE
jgi:lipopolysaccharide/colanic/teichoic acid biosynthesis glycosyltransferase